MTDYQFYMLLATAAGPVVALVVGAQCLLIFRGLRQMEAASRARDQLHAETMTAMESRHAKTMAAMERRHAETMTALKELIRRTRGGVE